MEYQATPVRQATLRDLVAVIFRQKWIILTILSVTTISVFLFNLRSPTTYESGSRVQVRRGRVESAQAQGLRVLSWAEEMSSELETVRSYPVARRAQEILDEWARSGEIAHPIRLNRGGVSAEVIGESNVLEIAYTSQDASVCLPATNAVTAAYTEFRTEALTIHGVDEFFQTELARVNRELDTLEAEKTTLLESGAVTSKDLGRTFSDVLYQQKLDRMKAAQELEKLRGQLANARTALARDDLGSAFFLQLQFENMRNISLLQDEVNRNQLKRDELSATMTPQHPELRAVEGALESSKALLRKEILATVELLKNRIREEETAKATLDAQISVLEAKVAAFPAAEVKLAQLDHAIGVKQKEIEDLTRKQVASRINRATSQNVTVTLLAPAGPPSAKKTKDYVRMGLAPLMSLVVGFLVAFFVDSLDHTLRSTTDVEDHLGVPVLAALPESRS